MSPNTLNNHARALNALFQSDRMELLMEAHNGLSARIVDECGFKAIWASGFTIASSLGVRDSNEVSWTQVLNVLEYMSDATDLPILFDGDSGFGNFNTVRRLVRKLCQRSAAGVVIEDKLFPKMNSFVGRSHPLAEVEEFCGRIHAALDTREDDNFKVVARTEALIAGQSVDRALERAERYRAAGADAIFIHSRMTEPTEIFEFASQWQRRAPLVIAPTTYYQASFKDLEKAGITICICANHNLRAATQAMWEASRKIQSEYSLVGVERNISSLTEIFSLLEYDELRLAEQKYLAPVGE